MTLPNDIATPTSAGRYDATDSKGRRKAPADRLFSEDTHLASRDRRKLIGGTRDLARNYTAAAWAIRKHLDYTATFQFQARTGDDRLNQAIEAYLENWALADNCDVARRHPLSRLIRLLEARRTVDGDVFMLLLSDGKLQPIEAERIATPPPTISPPSSLAISPYTHGVRTDEAGAAIGFALCNRTGDGRTVMFEREIPAAACVQHGHFDRFDQVRGISPLASAYNTLRDTYEAFDYALAKLKVAQLFGLVFYRDGIDSVGAITEVADTEETGTRYDVDFGRGPVKLELEPGDKAEFLESKTPGSEFQSYTTQQIALALKALDIPYSFFDESFTNYSGARQALLMYEQSAASKRRELAAVLDRITTWRLALAVIDGELRLPAGVTVADLDWEWIPTGLPWIDPLKEITADVAAINAGLDSTPSAAKRSGGDAYELARQEAAYRNYRRQLGLPVDLPAAITANQLATAPEPPANE